MIFVFTSRKKKNKTVEVSFKPLLKLEDQLNKSMERILSQLYHFSYCLLSERMNQLNIKLTQIMKTIL